MLVFGIVSEYNPLHNGHIYQIKRIKKEFPDAYILCYTSGNFVQRGEPSFISKHFKAEQAILNGADLVIEMPTIISLQSANYFSYYSVKMLNKLNILSHLSFGVEKTDTKTIIDAAKFEIEHKYQINDSVKKYMDNGQSMKKSFILTLNDLGYDHSHLSQLPNNTLAIQYIKALYELNSPIKIHTVERSDKGYHSEEITDLDFQSGTALRKAYSSNENIDRYLPYNLTDNDKQANTISLNDYSHIFYYKAFVENLDGDEIAGYENGILNLIRNNYIDDLDQAIELSHNKRYSKARLKRYILNYLLGINKEYILNMDEINYIRPLKFNDRGAKLLKHIKDNSTVNIINKVTNLEELDAYNRIIFDLDMKANLLYNMKNTNNNATDYTEKPYMK